MYLSTHFISCQVVKIYTSSGGDADQTGDHALNCADDRGFTEEDDVEDEPRQQACGGAHVGVQHSQGGIDADHVGVASVEPGPAHPQQPCSCQHKKDIVWREPFPVLG